MLGLLQEPPDGQSGDRSGSLQLSLLFLKAGPAGGRLRRPSSRRQRHDGRRGTGLAEGPLAKGLYYRPDHEWHSRTGSRPARPVNRRASTC
jgi:hypothetical protein